MSDSVEPHRRQPTRLLCPWDSLGKNTGVGCHFLLQEGEFLERKSSKGKVGNIRYWNNSNSSPKSPMEPCKQDCWDMWRFDGFHPLCLMLVCAFTEAFRGKRHSSLSLHRVHTCPVSRLDGR